MDLYSTSGLHVGQASGASSVVKDRVPLGISCISLIIRSSDFIGNAYDGRACTCYRLAAVGVPLYGRTTLPETSMVMSNVE